MSEIVVLADVHKSYQRGSETVAAVAGISLTVAAGEFLALVGPSGSGKSTLLNVVGCLDRPDRGSVQIEGQEVGSLNDAGLTNIRAKKIGFVFQQFFLMPTLTAAENVQVPAVFARRADQKRRALDLLQIVQLGHRASHRPGQLSGGEMQRVAIARALMNEPRILLADEATGSLDEESAARVLRIFRGLCEKGLAIVMVTHSLDLARHADRILSMRGGRISD